MFNQLDFFKQYYILKEILDIQPEFLKNKEENINNILIQYLIFNDQSKIQHIHKLKTLLEKIALKHMVEKKPLSKIFKRKFFYNMCFTVTQDVLCPRQETEILIDKIKFLEPKSILDLCTGSGVLAITLKSIFPNTPVYAIDICDKALEIAKINASNNRTDVLFFQNDLLENNILNKINKEKIDILICNPPYLSKEEINAQKELMYDPEISLLGGKEGWEIYERISKYNKYFNHIFLEINPKHVDKMNELFPGCEFIKDYNNDNRFLHLKNF